MAVKSAERVLKIFELLKDYPEGLTNQEISEKLGYAASSTLAILPTLVDNDFLSLDQGKKYTLGSSLIALGSAAKKNMSLDKVAEPILKDLMAEVQETCFLAIRRGENIVYIAKKKGPFTVATNVDIGSMRPVYSTGLGKAFLAFLPEDETKELLDNMPDTQYTSNTITDRAVMETQLKQFRKQGYTIDNQEMEDGLWCVAVPIYNETGKVIATMSVSGPYKRMQEKKKSVIKAITEAGVKFSRKLGYVKEDHIQ